MRLTEEYKRITEHFKDLQAKFSHFQQADLNKYQAVSPPDPYPLPAAWGSVTCTCFAQGFLFVYAVPMPSSFLGEQCSALCWLKDLDLGANHALCILPLVALNPPFHSLPIASAYLGSYLP